jgi:hypothetical protein
MEVIVELVIGFFTEIVLTVFGEALVELGLHSVTEGAGGKRWKRFFYAIWYALAACLVGYVSLSVMPLVVFGNRAIVVLYFVVAPLIAGLSLCLVSWIINRGINDRSFFQPAKFVYGVVFAFTFSLTRTIFG